MFRPASGRLIGGSSRQQTKSETSAERDVDEEDPVPAPRVGDEPADARTEQRREPEHRPEQPEVLAALGRRVQVGDHRERHREDRPTAEALQAAEQDELPHLLAEAAQERRDDEQRQSPDEDRTPAVQVRELAVDRAADRRRQQVDRDCPRVQRVAVEVRDDDRERRADDRLVECEQEQRQQDRQEDLELLAIAQVDARRLVRGHGSGNVGHGEPRGQDRGSRAPAG